MTTGNSEFRLPGLTVGPGITTGNGGEAIDVGEDGVGDGFAPTAAVIDASAGESPAACTVTVSMICSPTVALVRTLLVRRTSIACWAGRSPIEHV